MLIITREEDLQIIVTKSNRVLWVTWRDAGDTTNYICIIHYSYYMDTWCKFSELLVFLVLRTNTKNGLSI